MKNLIRSLFVSLGLSFLALPAWASDGGFQLTVDGFFILDFIVFVGLIWFFAKGPARSFLQNRYNTMKADLEKAQILRDEAEARMKELEVLLAEAETKVASIQQEFREDGEREKARVEAETERRLEGLRTETKRILEQEMAKLRESLEHDLVNEILTRTESKVKDGLNPSVKGELANSYLEKLKKMKTLEDVA